MASLTCADFYLGANTPGGFISLFPESYTTDWTAYIIKGGPGSGKSTLMKSICAQCLERSIFCERIHCSSDPDSLDAVIIPSMRTAVYDGTAPHVLEPKYPGACERMINMGDAWDADVLRRERDAVISLSEQCSACHARAAGMLMCAGAFRRSTGMIMQDALDRSKLGRYARGLFHRNIPKQSGSGREERRLLSAVTPQGIKMLDASFLYDTVVAISDLYDLPSGELMGCLREQLLESGSDIITCLCSQDFSRIEHIIVPGARIIFTTCSEYHHLDVTGRMIHSERFLDHAVLSEHKNRLAGARRAETHFYELASNEMRKAKALHDKLESIYIGAMDFSRVQDITEKTIEEIFR